MQDLFKHISHYTPLLGVLVAGALGFFIFSYDKAFQSVVIMATAVGYVAWGLVHHHLHKDLDTSVITEYIVFALLGLIIVLSIVFRS